MGRVFKKVLYRPVPEGAKIIADKQGKKYAYWIVDGEEFTAEYVDSKNGPRITEESTYYIARYNDATGRFRERSTGCRDLRAAEHKLSVWLQEIEKVKSGIFSQEEFEVGKRINETIEDQLIFFEDHLKAKGTSSGYIRETTSKIRKICAACRFQRMVDMNSTSFLRWLNKKGAEGNGARTRNGYREAMITFSNWAVRSNILVANPFGRVPKARESADKRHERRALVGDEIVKLFQAAEARPIHDTTLVRRGPRKGNHYEVRDTVKAQAVRLGLERKLLYAALIYTGLRKNELASITIGQVFLDHEIPHLVLKAKDEKSRRGANLPLHPELVTHLRKWLSLRKVEGTDSQQEKLFNVPNGLDKILNRDLKFAGIEKRDVLNRVIDVHALRHTHATLLAQKGVSPTVAKNAMRHSDIRMTMGVYTHLELGDVAEGVNRLPNFLEQAKKDEK